VQVPTAESLNLEDLGLSDVQVQSLLTVDRDLWTREVEQMHDYFASLMESDDTPIPDVRLIKKTLICGCCNESHEVHDFSCAAIEYHYSTRIY